MKNCFPLYCSICMHIVLEIPKPYLGRRLEHHREFGALDGVGNAPETVFMVIAMRVMKDQQHENRVHAIETRIRRTQTIGAAFNLSFLVISETLQAAYLLCVPCSRHLSACSRNIFLAVALQLVAGPCHFTHKYNFL